MLPTKLILRWLKSSHHFMWIADTERPICKHAFRPKPKWIGRLRKRSRILSASAGNVDDSISAIVLPAFPALRSHLATFFLAFGAIPLRLSPRCHAVTRAFRYSLSSHFRSPTDYQRFLIFLRHVLFYHSREDDFASKQQSENCFLEKKIRFMFSIWLQLHKFWKGFLSKRNSVILATMVFAKMKTLLSSIFSPRESRDSTFTQARASLARARLGRNSAISISIRNALRRRAVREKMGAMKETNKSQIEQLNREAAQDFVNARVAPKTQRKKLKKIRRRRQFMCPICIEDTMSWSSERYTIMKLDCGHLLHANCCKEWILCGSVKCPTCRDTFQGPFFTGDAIGEATGSDMHEIMNWALKESLCVFVLQLQQ